ncbi:flagellar basal body rod protein FlgB [Aquibacillus koreensis]|uniref:Flagellar basal body rod protein FlgB n=1 Tax=Aquibacillus koreensis TaxID=279446 RepID=A0A9X3WN42_9BACI|nr:flagellar basal body rod protein FlgB [Aquibacillus koreensis]MCT2534516.1 flagellar basal body rod protein FlgB [Aquibacillus koreensis]MDC3421890.1 flagellar basal body rod protein FlgB [Aquibacillus koreensis]
MSLFGGTISKLENSIDYATLKNQTIANNIANVDTANYKAKKVSFKNVLNQQVDHTFQAKRTHPKHVSFDSTSLSKSPFRVVTDQSTSFNHNGNNVDIDKQMTELAENQIYYQALIDRINGKFNSLNTVIKGGR